MLKAPTPTKMNSFMALLGKRRVDAPRRLQEMFVRQKKLERRLERLNSSSASSQSWQATISIFWRLGAVVPMNCG